MKFILLTLFSMFFVKLTCGQSIKIVDVSNEVSISEKTKITQLGLGDRPWIRIDDISRTIKYGNENDSIQITHYLDSTCVWENDIPVNGLFDNCYRLDTVDIETPKGYFFDRGLSHNMLGKQEKKNVKKLKILKTLFPDVDSIISAKEIHIDKNNKIDLAVVHLVTESSYFNEDEKRIFYRLDIYLNKTNVYKKIISSVCETNTMQLIITDFKIEDLPTIISLNVDETWGGHILEIVYFRD